MAILDAPSSPRISVAATVTSSATLAANKDTPVDATAGPITVTLPTTAAAGAMVAVEKIDASANAVTVSGTIRGVASSQIPLTSQYEARTFLSEGSGSWRPLSDHRTKASLDATYAPVSETTRATAAEGALRDLSDSAFSSALASAYAPLNATRPKQAVRACATTNVSLTAPGATIDGVTLVSGDRLLLTGNTNAAENGLYVFSSSSTTLVRTTDANTSAQLLGSFVFVAQGITQSGTGWELTNAALVLNTTAQNWVQFDAVVLPTTAGDLVVGSGTGTQSRLPVGTTGQVLMADSEQANKLAWKTAPGAAYPPALRSGTYHYCNSAGAVGTGALGIGTPRVSPWLLPSGATITRLGFEYTVAGDAGSVARLGIWTDAGTGSPDALVLDAGTVSTGGTPGTYEITLASPLTLVAGLYWVGLVVQTATTAPTVRTVSTSNIPIFQMPLSGTIPAAGGGTVAGYSGAAQSGALVAFTSPTPVATLPRMFYKSA